VKMENPLEGDKKVCTFVKRSGKNIRKRTSDSTEEDDTTVVQKQKVASGPLTQSTKSMKRTEEDLSVKSNPSAVPFGSADQRATATFEVDERKAEKEGEILSGDKAELAEKLYHGINKYTEWLPKKEQTGAAKGAGICSGPIRSNATNVRSITLMDYQPDICKDYKETGYCGFGDSCKFMHDRGDYKSGWQLENEWNEMMKNSSSRKPVENLEISEDNLDDIPFACSICRNSFVEPIKTKCGHFFCEKCQLDRFKKDMKCASCGENTMGIFNPASKADKKKLQRKREIQEELDKNLLEDESNELPEGEIGKL